MSWLKEWRNYKHDKIVIAVENNTNLKTLSSIQMFNTIDDK